MITGFKKFGATFVVGALFLSIYSPIILAETALDGVAAIIAASNGMVVPAIMASSQQKIAQTNANTSMYLNTLAAQTQAYGVQASTQTSMFNTLATLRIASMNNQQTLEQTYLATAFQAWDRNLNYQLKREQMYSDNYFKQRELDLKATLAQAEIMEKQAQFQANLQARGLSTGFQPVRAVSSLSFDYLNATPVRPNFGYVNPNQWMVPKFLQPRAYAFGPVFNQATGLAGGSSRMIKRRGDITRFLAQKPSGAHFPLHQARTTRGEESTHSLLNIGTIR